MATEFVGELWDNGDGGFYLPESTGPSAVLSPISSPVRGYHSHAPLHDSLSSSTPGSTLTPNIPQMRNEDDGEYSHLDQPPHTEELHDEFLQFVKDSGIEGLAKEVGVIGSSGDIPALREYSESATVTRQNKTKERRDTNLHVHAHPHPPLPPSQQPTNSQPSSLATSRGRRRKLDNLTESKEQLTDSSGEGVSVSEGIPLNSSSESVGNSKLKKRRITKNNGGSGEKYSKGLRHFSLKVCQKVESKKNTTYNQVADELVEEYNSNEDSASPVDQKNIRRRVYDALNVLMAMGIIAKEKKDIQWIGLPTNAKQELESMEEEKQQRIERIKKKKATLDDVLLQQNVYQSLLKRNTKSEFADSDSKIAVPFIIVNTESHTVIECEVSDDRTAYFFNFSLPFEIHDDSEILKRMGFAQHLHVNTMDNQLLKT